MDAGGKPRPRRAATRRRAEPLGGPAGSRPAPPPAAASRMPAAVRRGRGLKAGAPGSGRVYLKRVGLKPGGLGCRQTHPARMLDSSVLSWSLTLPI